MNETKKLNEYRIQNNYHNYFKGNGIDIGCGSDVLSKSVFKNIESIVPYDKSLDESHDAMYCKNLNDELFDFVYSSHCLEHVIDPYEAFSNWLRICKPLGYLIVAIPHEIFYEKYKWPSIYNPNHKTSWSFEFKSNLPKSIAVMDFLKCFDKDMSLISCQTIVKDFDFNRFFEDQTRENAVCQIEFIVRKN
jgi:predicted SAM-dependent methyltransferase